MKKLIALFLPLVCVLFLISCSQQGQQGITNATLSDLRVDTEPSGTNYPIGEVQLAELDITVLTAWFDSEGFVPEMSQSKMIEKMGSYIYNGETIADATIGCFYDGPYGGGYDANGENFGFNNDYTAVEDGNAAVYTNSFYTKVPLDGLTLPFGIEFDDSLRDAMAKLGITINPANFTTDSGTDNTITLYKDERHTLIFKNWNLSKELIATDAPYEMIFTENYTFTRESNRESAVTRTIKLAFTPDENMLHKFSVEIQETYKLK